MEISEKIKFLREKQGLSKGKLAELANISSTYIGQIESKQKRPTVDILEQICSALGLTLVEFFSDSPPSIPLEVRRLIDASQGLTARQREAIILLIETIKEPIGEDV